MHDELFGSALLFEKVLHSGVEGRNLFEKLFYNLKEMVGVAVAANRQDKEFLRRFVRWKCSRSRGRAARGSKLMCLELIHGLFIT